MAAPFAPMKLCTKCRKFRPLYEYHRNRDRLRSDCKACVTVREKQRYAANREAVHEYNVQQYAAKRDERREDMRKRGIELKAQVLAHYGTVCACCGSADDLTIDHINGDGREYRETVFGQNKAGGMSVYRWIIANRFPTGLQVLCRSCNRSKGTGKRCRIDHRTERKPAPCSTT